MSPSPAPQAQPSFIERLKNLLMARGALGQAAEQGPPPTSLPPTPMGGYDSVRKAAEEAGKRMEAEKAKTIPAHAMGAVAGMPPGGPGSMGNYGNPSPMGQNMGPRMAPPQGGQQAPMGSQGLRYGGSPSAPPQPPPPVPGGTAPVLNTGGGQPPQTQFPQPHPPMPIGGQLSMGRPPMGSYGQSPMAQPQQTPPKPPQLGSYPR